MTSLLSNQGGRAPSAPDWLDWTCQAIATPRGERSSGSSNWRVGSSGLWGTCRRLSPWRPHEVRRPARDIRRLRAAPARPAAAKSARWRQA